MLCNGHCACRASKPHRLIIEGRHKDQTDTKPSEAQKKEGPATYQKRTMLVGAHRACQAEIYVANVVKPSHTWYNQKRATMCPK